jgi:F-type H+-transporting ATPase subunit gamma
MANLREIKARIDSVKSTMQVTRTMEMISTAKIRRALERAQEAEPYKDAITRMLSNVAAAGFDDSQPLLQPRDVVRSTLFILIASDRGMAGGFNIVPQRMVQHEMERLTAAGQHCELITCGKKPTEYFTYRGFTPVLSFSGNSSEPTMDDADRIASYLMEGYSTGKLDRVVIYYSHARNRVDQEQVVEALHRCTKRKIGNAGGYGFDSEEPVDTTVAESLALAHWRALQLFREPEEKPMEVW